MPSAPLSLHKTRQSAATVTVGHWLMSEGSGTTSADASGNSRTGTLDGGTAWATTGRHLQTLSFPGTNGNHLTIANSAALQPANITILLWGALDAAGSYPMWCTCFSAPFLTGYELRCNGGNKTLEFLVGNGAANDGPTGSTVLALSTWYFLCATHDGTNTKVYVNGVQDGTKNLPGGSIVANTNPVWVGDRSTAGGNPLTGRIDDLQIRNMAMTGDQIAAEYQLLTRVSILT